MSESKVVNPNGPAIDLPQHIKDQLSAEELSSIQQGVSQITQHTPQEAPQQPPIPSASHTEFKQSPYPTVMVDLPSKGLFYPPNHPLHTGKIEMKYMTAKEEDILTTESYIKSGVVLDKLFQSLIVTDVNYNDILAVDKEALMVASRIYGYGEIYDSQVTTPSGNQQRVAVNLAQLQHLPIDESQVIPGKNELTYTTPSGDVVKFKLITIGENLKIQEQIAKDIKNGNPDTSNTTRLAQRIISVNDNSDRSFVKSYVTNMLVRDSRALKQFIKDNEPGIDLTISVIDEETGMPFRSKFTIGLDLLWPDVRL